MKDEMAYKVGYAIGCIIMFFFGLVSCLLAFFYPISAIPLVASVVIIKAVLKKRIKGREKEESK